MHGSSADDEHIESLCCFQPLFGAGLGLGMIITERKRRRHESREGYFGESQVSLDHELANAGLIKDPRLSDSEPANHDWPPHTILASSVCDTKQRRAGPGANPRLAAPSVLWGIPFIKYSMRMVASATTTRTLTTQNHASRDAISRDIWDAHPLFPFPLPPFPSLPSLAPPISDLRRSEGN